MKKLTIVFSLVALALSAAAWGQPAVKPEVLANAENTPRPVHPLPHQRQIDWMRTEFYAFFHYGMNTFTGREWGNGDEAESLYNPTADPTPRQWLEVAKSAGMRGGMAVVKHHDGFCLWPTATTSHSIGGSGNAHSGVNIPEAFATAARSLGMKYGFYVSPWDRNSAFWGTDEYVSEVFIKQCLELAQYGDDQFEMWFDGASGDTGYYGGANERRTIDRKYYYDFFNLRDTIHAINPNCVMWGDGGEARWIGNEAGYANETNWCTINRVKGSDQPNAASGGEDGWCWMPGESDWKATTSGWFWHQGEGIQSCERLFQAYLETVGRNATFILNLPPDKSGSLPQQTVTRMKELGEMLTKRLGNDLARAEGTTVTASETRADGATVSYSAMNVIDGDTETYWAANDGSEEGVTLTIEMPEAVTVRYVTLMEHIALGQRVKSFEIETSTDGTKWTTFGGGMTKSTIGYKRIIAQNGSTASSYGSGVKAKFVRVTFKSVKSCPVIESVQVY